MVIIAGAVALLLTQRSPTGGVQTAEAQCEKAGHLDCFPEVGMLDTQGYAWTGEETRGKVVLVNFWATWCKPCVREIPLLNNYYEQYKDDGLVILGVMTDAVTDDQLKHFARRHNLTYPVVRSDQLIMQAFDYPDALPTTFLYDRSGKFHSRHIGPLSETWLEQRLPKLLTSQ